MAARRPNSMIPNGPWCYGPHSAGAYAAHLRAAGVPSASVRYNGTIHDFVMLNALRAKRFT